MASRNKVLMIRRKRKARRRELVPARHIIEALRISQRTLNWAANTSLFVGDGRDGEDINRSLREQARAMADTRAQFRRYQRLTRRWQKETSERYRPEAK